MALDFGARLDLGRCAEGRHRQRNGESATTVGEPD